MCDEPNSLLTGVKRIEFYNAHRCALYASVDGVDSTVRFAAVRSGSQRFAAVRSGFTAVCSVNGTLELIK